GGPSHGGARARVASCPAGGARRLAPRGRRHVDPGRREPRRLVPHPASAPRAAAGHLPRPAAGGGGPPPHHAGRGATGLAGTTPRAHGAAVAAAAAETPLPEPAPQEPEPKPKPKPEPEPEPESKPEPEQESESESEPEPEPKPKPEPKPS